MSVELTPSVAAIDDLCGDVILTSISATSTAEDVDVQAVQAVARTSPVLGVLDQIVKSELATAGPAKRLAPRGSARKGRIRSTRPSLERHNHAAAGAGWQRLSHSTID